MENVEELSGCALDAAVARHLFEFEVEERRNTRTGELDAVYDVSRSGEAPAWVRVPYYSRSLSGSVQVELELLRRGWTHQDQRGGVHWNEPGSVRVLLKHADGRTVEAVGAPDEALCRAAVKAVDPW
jgi:hypothetical protein